MKLALYPVHRFMIFWAPAAWIAESERAKKSKRAVQFNDNDYDRDANSLRAHNDSMFGAIHLLLAHSEDSQPAHDRPSFRHAHWIAGELFNFTC